jgi:hypothetical protein
MIDREMLSTVRFSPDPRRPYIGRARGHGPDGPLFLKRYDLTAWSGTRAWRARVGARCALIERVTGGRTRFRLDGDLLFRVSVSTEKLSPLSGSGPLSRKAFGHLWGRIDLAHGAGLCHGDLTPRNVVTDGVSAEMIDWEPILVAPGPAPATDPAPDRVTDPSRWLGGCDLLRHAPRNAVVSQLDLIGLNRLRGAA